MPLQSASRSRVTIQGIGIAASGMQPQKEKVIRISDDLAIEYTASLSRLEIHATHWHVCMSGHHSAVTDRRSLQSKCRRVIASVNRCACTHRAHGSRRRCPSYSRSSKTVLLRARNHPNTTQTNLRIRSVSRARTVAYAHRGEERYRASTGVAALTVSGRATRDGYRSDKCECDDVC